MIFYCQTSLIIIFQCLRLCLDLINSVQQIRLADYFELRSTIYKSIQYIKVIVRPFCTINNRTSFNSDTSPVGFYLIIGTYGTYIHIKMYLYLITLLPFPVNCKISLLQFRFYFLTINLHTVFRANIVAECIQVTRYDFIPYPSRNTDFQCELSG